jgi:hypothetical protein
MVAVQVLPVNKHHVQTKHLELPAVTHLYICKLSFFISFFYAFFSEIIVTVKKCHSYVQNGLMEY